MAQWAKKKVIRLSSELLLNARACGRSGRIHTGCTCISSERLGAVDLFGNRGSEEEDHADPQVHWACQVRAGLAKLEL